jgi:hypothetical protein
MTDITYKTKMVDGKEVYFSSDWINDLETEVHFNWYFNQAKMVYSILDRDQEILEIGLGTGLLSDLLKKRNWRVKTLDIDAGKHPDFCESAVDFSYAMNNVDCVLAFEIFEHIPYSTFEKLIKRLSQEKVKIILFSVPWNEIQLLSVSLKLPKNIGFGFSLRFPKRRITTHAHFWELSQTSRVQADKKRLIKQERMISLFNQNGYDVDLHDKVGVIQYFSARTLAG